MLIHSHSDSLREDKMVIIPSPITNSSNFALLMFVPDNPERLPVPEIVFLFAQSVCERVYVYPNFRYELEDWLKRSADQILPTISLIDPEYAKGVLQNCERQALWVPVLTHDLKYCAAVQSCAVLLFPNDMQFSGYILDTEIEWKSITMRQKNRLATRWVDVAVCGIKTGTAGRKLYDNVLRRLVTTLVTTGVAPRKLAEYLEVQVGKWAYDSPVYAYGHFLLWRTKSGVMFLNRKFEESDTMTDMTIASYVARLSPHELSHFLC